MSPKFDQAPTNKSEFSPLSEEQIKDAAIQIGELILLNTTELKENGFIKIDLQEQETGALATFRKGIKGYLGGVDSLVEILKLGGVSAVPVYSEVNKDEVEYFKVRPNFKIEA